MHEVIVILAKTMSFESIVNKLQEDIEKFNVFPEGEEKEEAKFSIEMYSMMITLKKSTNDLSLYETLDKIKHAEDVAIMLKKQTKESN